MPFYLFPRLSRAARERRRSAPAVAGVFTFYKYNGENLLSDLTIVKYELVGEYIVLTDNNNSIYIYNSKTGVVDKNYVTVDNDSISYEINDNKIIIKNNGTEFDSYEIKSN